MYALLSRAANALATALVFSAAPALAQDFSIDQLGTTKATVEPGETFEVECLLSARRAPSARFSVKIGAFVSRDSRITADDVKIGGAIHSRVGSGLSAITVQCRVPETLPGGSAHFGLFVDYDDAFSETDESNNTRARPMTVRSIADLSVSSATIETPRLEAGGELSVRVAVKNNGNVPAGNAVFGIVGLFLGEGEQRLESDLFVGSAGMLVGPGQTVTRTIESRLPASLAGHHTLHVVADYNGLIQELDESNNAKRLSRDIQRIAPTARRVEWLPRLGTLARNVDTAQVFSRGGSADMSLVAPEFARGDYLCLWSGSPDLTIDEFSSLSMALLNGPVMPRWFGRLDDRGHASPQLNLPALPKFSVQIYTHAFVVNADRSRLAVSSNAAELRVIGL